MLAHSTPNRLPGKRAINPVTVIDKNPSTGTDCRISSDGKMMARATRLCAAAYPTAKVKSSEKPKQEKPERASDGALGNGRSGAFPPSLERMEGRGGEHAPTGPVYRFQKDTIRWIPLIANY